ncbi:hypothetical protein Dimus_002153 [Dionaea muscipula]
MASQQLLSELSKPMVQLGPVNGFRCSSSTDDFPVGETPQGSCNNSKWQASQKIVSQATYFPYMEARASNSMDDKNRIYKELGSYTVRRKIEDAVARAEILAPIALEHEEAKRIRREELIHEYNLWDDPSRSSEALVQLADSVKLVDTLKDLTYKAEEAKLITELANIDVVNHRLFEQAYNTSVDLSKFLDQYEMSKLLRGPYDMQGASLIIRAKDNDIYSEVWAEQLLNMYVKWAENQGRRGRIVEKLSSANGGIKSATVEFEFEYAYGYLLGEFGVHHMISSQPEPSIAAVDVVPLFLDMSPPDMNLHERDLIISSHYSSNKNAHVGFEHVNIRVEHVPTGLCLQSSGERNQTANKIKAVNRLKGKLFVIMLEQRVSSISNIRSDDIVDMWKQDTRRYVFYPQKLVWDLKTGVQSRDLTSVLDGNIEQLVEAHIINANPFCEPDDLWSKDCRHYRLKSHAAAHHHQPTVAASAAAPSPATTTPHIVLLRKSERGLYGPMLVGSNTWIRREVLVVSCFRRNWGLCAVRSCTSSSLSTQVVMHKPCAIGLRSRMMSSQIEEKSSSKLSIGEHFGDLPRSTSYENAMEALSSLITRQKRGDKSTVGGTYGKLQRMEMYLKILGLEEQIAGLRIIHVAGTKGKGSTCAFCEAILRECGLRTGLFTSPHLIDVRERFRINGLDISEEKFLTYFWDCWDQLRDKVTEDLPMPPLFQFLTVMAFKIFVCEKVDVAIVEVGLGGRNDSTNVIKGPVVCGIASLGMDHMEALGDTLEQIASHKAGILKPNTPAYTVPQLPEAMTVLEERAQQLMVPLEIVPPISCGKLDGLKLSLAGDHQRVNAALAIALCRSWLQRTQTWEKLLPNGVCGVEDLPAAFRRGLSSARLSGRAQVVYDSASKPQSRSFGGDLIFYLDGAHTPESMDVCARWFSSAVKDDDDDDEKTNTVTSLQNGCLLHNEDQSIGESTKIRKRILLFNCMEVRSPQLLLPQLVGTCASSGVHFSKALFVPSMSTYNKVTSGASIMPFSNRKDLSWQFSMQRIWEKIIHGTDLTCDKDIKVDYFENSPPQEFTYDDYAHCHLGGEGHRTCSLVIPSLPQAIKWLRDCVKENPSFRVQVLVTGSLHLVGDVLKLLRK